MHYEQLFEITSRWASDGVYEKAMQNLKWDFSDFDLARNIDIFEDFLGAWHSLRRPLGKETLIDVWTKEVEPYATALSGEFLENLDIEKIIVSRGEKLRVGVAIEHMYGALSTVAGVGETNASKLLHLRLPNLFVMTDTDVRSLFKIFRLTTFRGKTFLPYSYAFNFLMFVKSDVSEAIDTLSKEKGVAQQQAIELLRNAHDRKRSLAKLMDECYFTLAHKFKEFPDNFLLNIFASWRRVINK